MSYFLPLRKKTLARRWPLTLLSAGLLLAAVPASKAQNLGLVQSDKARYAPGQPVTFSVAIDQPQAGLTLEVKYYHTHALVSQQTVAANTTAATWTWTPPSTDYQGYLVGLTLKSGTNVLDEATLGVDVSSDWARFPRYGFLSEFGPKTSAQLDAMMQQLNRYHLNGLQFYDWMDKHHQPLPGTAQAPAATWNDLANRPTSLATLAGYIDRGHDRNMKSLFYNLVYGAYPNASADGVSDSWGLYLDANHNNRYTIGGLPSSWEASSLSVLDPANTSWQNYLLAENNKVYNATGLNFDGWHMDQVGDPGTVYAYGGAVANLPTGFRSMVNAAKAARPTKSVVMNAVNQFGQSQIAPGPVDIVYTEMWTGNEDYIQLGQVIRDNEATAPGKRNVLAAYVNKGLSNSTGYFNDASVLMADAVIFANGGSHIELGEHMLGNEYFPNSNLQMSALLQYNLTSYYDFLTAYENVLRDQNRTFTNVAMTGPNVQAWPPALGKVTTLSTSVGSSQVFHLLNFRNARTLNWRDNGQVQPIPNPVTNLNLSFPLGTPVTKLWMASPDINRGLPQQLTFTQSGGTVTFQLPELNYWTMVVAETGNITATAAAAKAAFAFSNAPNPFHGATTIHFTLPVREAVDLGVYDLSGRLVTTLRQGVLPAGPHAVELPEQAVAPGVYLCRLQSASGTAVQRLVKLD
ncbi:glycoside hydrolase family 66 protein [Hymenobacter sp. M29]|uniref:Glycoside hydrolase family 66 protein n=1 Tax=Hymenobacter mellowenesis TaxID=3063995 RepID=A0ABT9AF90_9BACT|nr:glycoside hydrolase family 66 protein [Hymenobacter sp. M29]MDO7848532.1 glycoside hydrolase family 66 protein [Hymenobacter sp. M29]